MSALMSVSSAMDARRRVDIMRFLGEPIGRMMDASFLKDLGVAPEDMGRFSDEKYTAKQLETLIEGYVTHGSVWRVDGGLSISPDLACRLLIVYIFASRVQLVTRQFLKDTYASMRDRAVFGQDIQRLNLLLNDLDADPNALVEEILGSRGITMYLGGLGSEDIYLLAAFLGMHTAPLVNILSYKKEIDAKLLELAGKQLPPVTASLLSVEKQEQLIQAMALNSHNLSSGIRKFYAVSLEAKACTDVIRSFSYAMGNMEAFEENDELEQLAGQYHTHVHQLMRQPIMTVDQQLCLAVKTRLKLVFDTHDTIARGMITGSTLLALSIADLQGLGNLH